MSNFGIKISLPNQDVTNRFLNKFILNTDYSHMKIKLGETPRHFEYVSYTYSSEPANNSTTTLITVPHGYDYVPIAIVWLSFDNDTWFSIRSQFNFDPFTGSRHLYLTQTDATNLYIRLQKDGANPPLPNLNGTTVYFKYMIFTDEAA
jgi:hypothetical protein